MAIFQLEPSYDDIKMSPPEKPLQHHHGVYYRFSGLWVEIRLSLNWGWMYSKGEAKADFLAHCCILKKVLGYHNV